MILLTVLDGAETERLRELDPDPGRGLRIVQVANSYAELVKAIDGASDALREVVPKATLVGAAVDEAANAAHLYVLPGEGPEVRAASSKLQALLGVDVIVDELPMGHDAVCSNRDNCANPMKAGIRIHRGSTTSTWYCTQGFIVVDGTDEQILTSGHCGVGTNNNWYHPAYGTSAFGGEISPNTPDGTLYGPNGRDVMRVRFPDAQSTVSIYGQSEAIDMEQDRVPLQGEAIWFSGASTTTNPVRAGTVESAWWHWTSEKCSCEVYGGRGSWTPVLGDSGGPAYSRFSVSSPYPHLVVDPIGVISHQNGGFARVFDATIAWDLTMYGQ